MMLTWMLVTAMLLVSCRTNGGPVLNRSSTVEEERLPVSNQWKADVLDTLGALKEVLETFEQKWDKIPLESENGTVDFEEDTRSKPLEAANNTSQESGAVRNEFATSEREVIREDPTRRRRGEKTFGCPHAWPHHDIYPVVEPTCAADSDCQADKLCCQLFGKNYCLAALDSTPRSGECRFTEFNFLSSLHCLVDDPGCKYDSECSEPTWKCCRGPCQYKECLPSTTSPSASDLQRRQEKQLQQETSTQSPNNETTSFEDQHAEELPAVVTTSSERQDVEEKHSSFVEAPATSPPTQNNKSQPEGEANQETAVTPRADPEQKPRNKPRANKTRNEQQPQEANRRRTHDQRTQQRQTPRQEEQLSGNEPPQRPSQDNRQNHERNDDAGFDSVTGWQDSSTSSNLFPPIADFAPLPFPSESDAQGQTGVISNNLPAGGLQFDDTFNLPALPDDSENSQDLQNDFLPFFDFRFEEFEGGAFDDGFL